VPRRVGQRRGRQQQQHAASNPGHGPGLPRDIAQARAQILDWAFLGFALSDKPLSGTRQAAILDQLFRLASPQAPHSHRGRRQDFSERPRMTMTPSDRSEGTVDPKLLEILVCPVTKGPLEFDSARQELVSRSAKLAYPIRDGIPIMLPEEARKIE